MPQYLLAVYMVEGAEVPSDEVIQQMYSDVDKFNNEVKAAGAWVFGGGLHPANVATVVDNSSGEVTMTDGPFPESKEQIGGFWIVKAPDLDAALDMASRGSKACRGKVEVRPFQDESG